MNTKYLNRDDPQAHVDAPTPEEKLVAWQRFHNVATHVCPKCLGWGGHNLSVHVYPLPKSMEDNATNRHLYCHFRCSCDQCNGWGFVSSPSDFTCVHEFKRARNVGNCLNEYTCVKCGRVHTVDSSG